MSETKQTRLVVVVPSITDRTEPWDGLIAELQKEPGYEPAVCVWHRPQHGASWRSRISSQAVAERLAADIHVQWVAAGGFDSVVLVGHSYGALMVRYAYLHALGCFDENDKRDWAAKVERVILFAGLNRGIEVSWRRAWWLPLIATICRFLPIARDWVAHDVLRGSDFIANLRIAWLRQINTMPNPPVLVQFLGSSDRLVREDDSKDIKVFATGRQQLIPGATHSDLIRLDATDKPHDRRALIAQAFTEPPSHNVSPVGVAGQQVVIVLHGIRTSNDQWPRELEEIIESQWPGTEVIAAHYGWFSARKFLLPATRRKFLRELEDIYAERLAINPQATFHFVGHSNGTYLLGHSLARVPAMKFDRIALAGSVLPAQYEWGDRLSAEQFGSLRNHRSANDFPVGFLCSGLRGLLMRDVGTAGVDGFLWEDPAKSEVYYYPGGHGQALEDKYLPDLAKWVMEGVETDPTDLASCPKRGLPLLSRLAPVLAWGTVLAVGFAAFLFPGWSPLPLWKDLGILAAIGLTLFVVLDVV